MANETNEQPYKPVEFEVTFPLPDCEILPGIKKRAKLKMLNINCGSNSATINYEEQWLTAEGKPFKPQIEGMPMIGDIALNEIATPDGKLPLNDKFKSAIISAVEEFFKGLYSANSK